MMPFERGEEPALLHKHAPDITKKYIANRKKNPAYRFQWPQREKQSVYRVVFDALKGDGEPYCAYCDGFPMDDTGQEQVDHFHPKSRDEFYELVCCWENLFLICSACNLAKGEKWEAALLKPDEAGFDFFAYFSYESDTGKLAPNAGASDAEQHRAERTIEILNLNRIGACTSRKRVVKRLAKGETGEELADFGYRFLFPLFTGSN